MQQLEPSAWPDDAGSSLDRPTASAPRTAETRLEAMMQSYQAVMAERIDEGLRSIEQAGLRLMHEIAAEMWRSANGDPEMTRHTILSQLSRDQAIRGLIAHSDERFQALAVRAANLEDSLVQMVESNRALKDVMATAAQMVQEMASGTPEVRIEDVRQRLIDVSDGIEATFERIDDRDRILLDSIQGMNLDHGRMIAHETARIVEALEGYVQGGVDAIGRLAQRVEQQAEVTAGRADEIVQRLSAELGEQLIPLYNRFGLETRALTDSVSQSHAGARELGRAVMQALDQRVRALAQLMRSDSQALSKHIVETAAAQDHALTRAIDERLVLAGHDADERIERVRAAVDERMRKISEAITDASRWVVEESSSRGPDPVVQQRLDAMIGRLESAIGAVESAGVAIESTGLSIERQQGDAEGEITRALDERLGALARMIRSDNRALSERLSELKEPEGTRQLLRAVKELQAGLPAEDAETQDRRFATFAEQLHRESQETAETMAKVAEVLSAKMDRLGARYENDMQSVIESLGTAVQSIAMLGRRQADGPPQRIELD
jgi:hypothetical protein